MGSILIVPIGAVHGHCTVSVDGREHLLKMRVSPNVYAHGTHAMSMTGGVVVGHVVVNKSLWRGAVVR